MVQYLVPKPGPEPYVTPYTKSKTFQTKLVAVQNIAMMYPVCAQKKDKENYFDKIGKFSMGMDIANSNGPTSTQHLNHIRDE